jgi:hypothetical protein
MRVLVLDCLQDYVAACVETQQQQEKELGKLKAEKKDIEKVSRQLFGLHPVNMPLQGMIQHIWQGQMQIRTAALCCAN